MHAIQLLGVSRQYGKQVALRPTDLNIEKGKTTALIGPSGCGKSTLLRLIIGLVEPTDGRILIEGEPLTPSNALAIRRNMGYVIQDGGLFPHLNADQNIRLMAHHLKQNVEESSKRLEELRTLTGFPKEALTRYPSELSGGQRQRVSLMRALMLDPSILLLDEPLGALDPLVRSGLQTDLKAIFQKLARTVLIVTHDMAEAGYLADHIVLLANGQIVQQGTLEDLRDRPATPFVSEFMTAQRSLVQL